MQPNNTPFQEGPVDLSHVTKKPSAIPVTETPPKQREARDSLTELILRSGIIKNETQLRYIVMILVAVVFVVVFLILSGTGDTPPPAPPGYDI